MPSYTNPSPVSGGYRLGRSNFSRGSSKATGFGGMETDPDTGNLRQTAFNAAGVDVRGAEDKSQAAQAQRDQANGLTKSDQVRAREADPSGTGLSYLSNVYASPSIPNAKGSSIGTQLAGRAAVEVAKPFVSSAVKSAFAGAHPADTYDAETGAGMLALQDQARSALLNSEVDATDAALGKAMSTLDTTPYTEPKIGGEGVSTDYPLASPEPAPSVEAPTDVGARSYRLVSNTDEAGNKIGPDYYVDDAGNSVTQAVDSAGNAVAGQFVDSAGTPFYDPDLESWAEGAAGDAATGGVPIVGPVISLLRGNPGGAAGSLIGGAIGGPFGAIAGNLLGSAFGGGCFITEAVMASGGANDNAPELQVLRQFRDQVMMTTPMGQAMVQEYEAIAPMVVDAISMRPDAMQIFQQIKGQFIDPAIQAINANDQQQALRIYAEMIAAVVPFALETQEGPGAESAEETSEGQEGMQQLGDHAAMVANSPEAAAQATGDDGFGSDYDDPQGLAGLAEGMDQMPGGQPMGAGGMPGQMAPQQPAAPMGAPAIGQVFSGGSAVPRPPMMASAQPPRRF